MERLGVVGLSWRHADAQWLARFTLPEADRKETIAALAQELGVQEVLYLATCSRVELAYRADHDLDPQFVRRRVFASLTGADPQPGEAERTLRAWSGEGAAEHMLMVVTGLESAQLGETEILGQFRSALQEATQQGLASGVLKMVSEHAIKVARRLRHNTGIDHGKTSLAEIAMDKIREHQKHNPGVVGLVGVSAMTERCAAELARNGDSILWINRTSQKAQEALLASGGAGDVISLQAFQQEPSHVSCMVLATGAPSHVLGVDTLSRLAKINPSAMLLDMGVPADVDPSAAAESGLKHVGIDEVLAQAERSSQLRGHRAVEARVGIDEALEQLRDLCGTSALGPMARALQEHYRESAAASLQRLFRSDMPELGEAQQARLLDWSRSWAQQMAHLPTTGLRQVVREQGVGVLEAFLSHAQPDLARDIRSAMGLSEDRGNSGLGGSKNGSGNRRDDVGGNQAGSKAGSDQGPEKGHGHESQEVSS